MKTAEEIFYSYFHSSEYKTDIIKCMEAYAEQQRPKVKALEWLEIVHLNKNDSREWWAAETPIGDYVVKEGYWEMSFIVQGKCTSIEDGKIQCQKDFERRINECYE